MIHVHDIMIWIPPDTLLLAYYRPIDGYLHCNILWRKIRTSTFRGGFFAVTIKVYYRNEVLNFDIFKIFSGIE